MEGHLLAAAAAAGRRVAWEQAWPSAGPRAGRLHQGSGGGQGRRRQAFGRREWRGPKRRAGLASQRPRSAAGDSRRYQSSTAGGRAPTQVGVDSLPLRKQPLFVLAGGVEPRLDAGHRGRAACAFPPRSRAATAAAAAQTAALSPRQYGGASQRPCWAVDPSSGGGVRRRWRRRRAAAGGGGCGWMRHALLLPLGGTTGAAAAAAAWGAGGRCWATGLGQNAFELGLGLGAELWQPEHAQDALRCGRGQGRRQGAGEDERQTAAQRRSSSARKRSWRPASPAPSLPPAPPPSSLPMGAAAAAGATRQPPAVQEGSARASRRLANRTARFCGERPLASASRQPCLPSCCKPTFAGRCRVGAGQQAGRHRVRVHAVLRPPGWRAAAAAHSPACMHVPAHVSCCLHERCWYQDAGRHRLASIGGQADTGSRGASARLLGAAGVATGALHGICRHAHRAGSAGAQGTAALSHGAAISLPLPSCAAFGALSRTQ